MAETSDRHARQAAERGWTALARLVSTMLALIAEQDGRQSGLRLSLLRLLRPAEVLARRLLVLMAARLPQTVLARPASQPDRTGWAGRRKAVPAFSFVEPLQTNFASWFGNAPDALSDQERAEQASAAERPAPGLERLKARLGALQAVLDDPAREARRVARWMHAGSLARRSLPIRMARPPGGRPGHVDRETATLLLDLHHFARTVEWPP